MKEKPILLSKKMVRAILSGKKTQTRRVIKPQPENDMDFLGWGVGKHDSNTVYFGKRPVIEAHANAEYAIDDHLWVKESVLGWRNLTTGKWEVADGCPVYCDNPEWNKCIKCGKQLTKKKGHPAGWYVISARFLPKDYVRLWLEVKSVAVARIQDITDGEALCEGVEKVPNVSPRESFISLWTSRYGHDPVKNWDANPWVFVYTFRVLHLNG